MAEVFLGYIPQAQVAKLLHKLSAAGKPLKVWFQDEARVEQKGCVLYQ